LLKTHEFFRSQSSRALETNKHADFSP